ncbi:MAG: hypothetical protein HUJ68_09335 [Clostridia bacterium]|nr:hypothetical protein [Clostridia bacterium]
MKKIVSIIITAVAVSVMSAESYRVTKPRANQVTIVGKITVDDNYDADFLREALEMQGCKVDNAFYSSRIVKEDVNPFIDKNDDRVNRNANGAFFAKTIKLPEDRVVKYPLQIFYLLESKKAEVIGSRIIGTPTRAYVQLPMFIQFEVPESDQYVYIGSYHFSMKGNFNPYLDSVTDEFDEAAEFLNEYVKDAELVRANVENWRND